MKDKTNARLTRRQFTHAGAAAFGLVLFNPAALWAQNQDRAILCGLEALTTEHLLELKITLTNASATGAGIHHYLLSPVIAAPIATLKVDGLTLEMTSNDSELFEIDRRKPRSRVGPRLVLFELPPKTPRLVASFQYPWPKALQNEARRFQGKLAEVSLSLQTRVTFQTREEGTRAPNITRTLTLEPEAISMRLPKVGSKA